MWVTRELLDAIGGAIVGGDFETGATLPTEAAMSDRFSASRTVTREAVKMLTATDAKETRIVKPWL